MADGTTEIIEEHFHGPVLDPSDRPPALQEECTKRFKEAKYRVISEDDYNGVTLPQLAGIEFVSKEGIHSQIALVKNYIVNKFSNGQENFYFLDIDTGGFAWSNMLLEHIEKFLEKLRLSVKVHIICMRRESYTGKTCIEKGRIKVYRWGNIDVESDLTEQFKATELRLPIDIIYCNFALHADPLGVFVRMCELLTLNGIMLAKDFFPKPDSQVSGVGNTNISILGSIEFPFYDVGEDLILERSSRKSCRLACSYANDSEYVPDPVEVDGVIEIGSFVLTKWLYYFPVNVAVTAARKSNEHIVELASEKLNFTEEFIRRREKEIQEQEQRAREEATQVREARAYRRNTLFYTFGAAASGAGLGLCISKTLELETKPALLPGFAAFLAGGTTLLYRAGWLPFTPSRKKLLS